MKKRVLVVAAHPDDQVLGCGGTLARLVDEGCEAFCLILGEGATSRDPRRNRSGRAREISSLRRQTREADRILGIRKTFHFGFPDNRFDTVALLDVVKAVEKVKAEVEPALIFTHDSGDLNIDHRVAHEAVLTAARPVPGEPVREIYAFEVPSSSEWAYPPSFRPDVFYDVASTLTRKLDAMRAYADELRAPPHPRSLEGIETFAAAWGFKTGMGRAEAFRSLRVLR